MQTGTQTTFGRAIPAAVQVSLAVEVFRMLADSTRVCLLCALLDEELSVNELSAMVGRPSASVSQHLAKLRMAGLVRTRRNGTQVFYRVDNEHVRQLIEDAVYHADHASHGSAENRGGDPAASALTRSTANRSAAP